MKATSTISMTEKRRKELQPQAIAALARKKGVSHEEAVFLLLRDLPPMFGAVSDWDDIRNISVAVIRELKDVMTISDVYRLVLNVVTLYDTQVITVLRIESDVKRLAMFVNEMIEQLLEVKPYCDGIEHIVTKAVGSADRIAMRGIVLRRITRSEVRRLLVNDRGRFFKAEISRSEGIEPEVRQGAH